MKPGYLTTEFWITLATHLFTVLTTLTILSAPDATALANSTTAIITATFALATNAAAIIKYIGGRNTLKAKQP